jgi:hypothetical protein
MLSPEKIIEAIQEDAPCVYDILLEEYYPSLKETYPELNRGYPMSDSKYTWDDYFEEQKIVRPTPNQLLEVLTEYSGNNHDVHYWNGRYAQILEIDKDIDSMIAVYETNRKNLAKLMDYEYGIKIDILKIVQEFLTQPQP